MVTTLETPTNLFIMNLEKIIVYFFFLQSIINELKIYLFTQK